MGLIETEIKEIRELIKQFDAGKVSKEDVQIKIGLYSQTEKREKMALQAFNVAAKYGKRHFQRLVNSDLIGDGKKIDLGEEQKLVEDQTIHCPWKNKTITREECLDFSGETENYERCKDCIIGKGNKKLFVPNISK